MTFSSASSPLWTVIIEGKLALARQVNLKQELLRAGVNAPLEDGARKRRVPESQLFPSARLCPRYQRGVSISTRMRDKKALFSSALFQRLKDFIYPPFIKYILIKEMGKH